MRLNKTNTNFSDETDERSSGDPMKLVSTILNVIVKLSYLVVPLNDRYYFYY